MIETSRLTEITLLMQDVSNPKAEYQVAVLVAEAAIRAKYNLYVFNLQIYNFF